MISDKLNRLTCGVLVHSTQMAYVEDAAGTYALLEDFTSLFRYLSREEKMIPLDRELRALKSYVHLQTIRYPGRFEISPIPEGSATGIYVKSGSILEFFDDLLSSLIESNQAYIRLDQSIGGENSRYYELRISCNLYANMIYKRLELTDEI